MNIFLIRHARQDSKLCNVNVPLSMVGRKQAELLGKRLHKYHIDMLYSSDYMRAEETARIVNQYLKVPHELRNELREIDFGALQGNSDEYNLEHYGTFLKERTAMTSDLKFPSGECGLDVWNRAKDVLNEIICANYENVAVVTHGGTIRSILSGILGVEQTRKLQFGLCLENTSITEINYHKERKCFYLERFNDYAHLEQEPELLRNNW